MSGKECLQKILNTNCYRKKRLIYFNSNRMILGKKIGYGVNQVDDNTVIDLRYSCVDVLVEITDGKIKGRA